jgi:hypothetical protein
MFNIFKTKKIQDTDVPIPSKGVCAAVQHEFFVLTEQDIEVLYKIMSDHLRERIENYLKTKPLDTLIVVSEKDVGRYSIMTKEEFIKEYKILEESE